MLHAPTNDRKTKSETSSKTAEHLSEQEQSSHLSRSRQAQPQQRQNMATMQNAYGNQALVRMVQRQEIAPNTPEATPLVTTVSAGSLQVPQGQGGQAGSVDTDTFSVPLSTTLQVSSTASYIGSSTNISDWSVQLFRSPWWGADEPIGTRRSGRVGGTISFSISPPDTPTRSYYLRFRNASQYEPILVTYTAML